MATSPTSVYRWLLTTLRQAAWAPLLVFCAHLVCSRVLHLYARVPGIDVPMHFAGGVAMAYFVHVTSRNGSRCGVLGSYHPLTHAGLVFGLTCAAAMVWEFAEFLSDRYLGTHAQGNDLEDTLADMLLGMLGAIVFLLVLFLLSRDAHAPQNEEPPG